MRAKKMTAGVISALATVLMFALSAALAGTLEPDGPPSGGTMHTLNELYLQNQMILQTISEGQSACQGAPVPRTGQAVSYAAGDDGDIQAGTAWPEPRFTDNGDGTVADSLTGLVWLQDAGCLGSLDWGAAIAGCTALDSGECGLSDGSAEGDWRLPSIRELQSLTAYNSYGPALPAGHPFAGVRSSYYWSGTTYVNNADYAWFVDMTNGKSVYNYTKSYAFYVWPVRDGN